MKTLKLHDRIMQKDFGEKMIQKLVKAEAETS